MLLNVKRPLILVGIILLAGGVVFEEKHRAATLINHIAAPDLKYSVLEVQSLATNNTLSASVNLWNISPVKTGGAGLNYTRANFQPDLMPASIDKFQPLPVNKTEPVITVMDREVAYALFASRDFTLTLDLKPEYSSPTSFMPSHIDPGIRGSFSF